MKNSQTLNVLVFKLIRKKTVSLIGSQLGDDEPYFAATDGVSLSEMGNEAPYTNEDSLQVICDYTSFSIDGMRE